MAAELTLAEVDGNRQTTFGRFLVLGVHVLRRLPHRADDGIQCSYMLHAKAQRKIFPYVIPPSTGGQAGIFAVVGTDFAAFAKILIRRGGNPQSKISSLPSHSPMAFHVLRAQGYWQIPAFAEIDPKNLYLNFLSINQLHRH